MVKVLVAGDAKGRFRDLIDRLSRVNASRAGPFDVAFCAGDVFGAGDGGEELQSLLRGELALPLPVYFVCSRSPASLQLDRAGPKELCANFTFLGCAGLRDVCGLSVAFLGGQFDALRFREPAPHSGTRGPATEVFTHSSEVRARGAVACPPRAAPHS